MALLPQTAASGAQLQTITAESDIVKSLYTEQGAAAEASGQSQAEETEASGDIAEGGDYQQAADIASNNAEIAQVSGQIAEFQNMRNVMTTIGQQKADIAGAGFGNSGTAVSLASSSLMQGLLANQVIGENANLQAGGFLEQAAASTAESKAATTAGAAAQELSASDAQQASIDSAAENADTAILSSISPTAGSIAKAITTGGSVSQVLQTSSTEGGGLFQSSGHLDQEQI